MNRAKADDGCAPSQENQVLADGSVWTIAHTTAALSSPVFVRRLVDVVRSIFSEEKLTVRWADTSGEEHTADYASMTPDEIASVYARGGICIADAGNRVFWAGISWELVPKRERRSFLRSIGYRQNEVFLRVHEDLLATETSRNAFVAACEKIAVAFDVTYLYVYDWRRQPAHFSTRDGLGVGIRDVYWLNIFGKPYIDMIGRDALLSAPAHDVRALDRNHLILRASDRYGDPSLEPMSTVRAAIRRHIGQQFFTKPPGKDSAPPPPAGAISIFNVVKLVKIYRHATREFYSTEENADTCPTFDWSNILLDE